MSVAYAHLRPLFFKSNGGSNINLKLSRRESHFKELGIVYFLILKKLISSIFFFKLIFS